MRRLGTPAFRVGAEVRGLAITPDLTRVVTCGSAGVCVWEFATGERLSVAQYPPRINPARLDFVPLAAETESITCNNDLVVLLWQGAAYRYSKTFETKPDSYPTALSGGGLTAVGFVEAEKSVLVGLPASRRVLTDRGEGRSAWHYNSIFRGPGDSAFISTGEQNAAWNEGNTKVAVYQITPQGHRPLGGVSLEGDLNAISLSRDGKWLGTVTAGEKGKGLQLWKVADQKESRAWKCPPTRLLALSRDGVLAAGCSGTDGKVWVYDTEAGKELTAIEVPDTIRSMQFVPKSTTLVFAGKAGVIHVYDARTGKPASPSSGHLGAVRAVAYTPDGGAVTASADGTAKLWDAAGKEVRTFAGHQGAVNALALSADGKTLFTGGADGTVRAWDVAKGTELRRLDTEKPASAGQCLALSADGKALAVGGTGGPIRLLAPDTLKLTKSLDAEGATALAFADERLVSRDAGHVIRIWDVAKGEQLEKATAFGGSAHAAPLAVSPDGKTVASVIGEEKGKPDAPAVEVGLWDSATGLLRERVQVGRREHDVTAVAFLPGGKAIAVGDSAGTVWVIDLGKKEPRHVFKGHRGPVLSLAASPDGKTLASGGADTTVLVWSLEKP